MTFYIDGERFEAWLREQQASLIQSAQERHQADDERDSEGNVIHLDPTALRMDGGAANLFVILNSLRNFETRPARSGHRMGSAASQGADRTPIGELDVPTRLRVGRHSPGTSWAAAYMQTPEKTQHLFRAIYFALTKFGPMNDDEIRHRIKPITDRYNYAPEGVTMRRSELMKAGWVRSSGERRRGDSRALMTVWEAVPEEL